jgi:xanthine dehydrogenase small subunit
MRDFIVLYVNGRRHEVRGAAVFQPLSGYLRNGLGLTGTKVVCSEGDCGSCTVLLGRQERRAESRPLNRAQSRPRLDSIEYRSVCSCVQFVFQSDGCHVVSVEGLGSHGSLDPVQEAMVQHHGTQCGYCTPGIVMSIHALLESNPILTEERLRKGLVGNLCRCTGYDPIVRAGMRLETGRTQRMNELFNSAAMVAELAAIGEQAVRLEWAGKTLYKPATMAEAMAFKAAHPECVIVSGGTDLGVQVNKGVREIGTVLSTAALSELRELRVGEEEIAAGSNVTIAELEAAATEALPEYAAMMARFGSPQIKNAATLGGNIANASPIGDTMPALFVLNARVELWGTKGVRQVNINEFYTGYKRTVAAADELISRVVIPRPGRGEVLRLFKVSKRRDLDISTFSAAVWLKLAGSIIEDVRIAYGGVAATIVRLPKTEAHLKKRTVSAEAFESAGEVALSEISPISDVRGSAEYRNLLAANILRKLYYELDAEEKKASAT